MSFHPDWSPDGLTGVHSPVVRGSRARVIRPSVWHVPLALPPSPSASGETELR